ncbi:polysaccharide pyruvyl transferase family protein [Sandaracinobacter sp. RS1-74]|uniref:polysaccharide pyruvyl transferase family protein n=1 Tax=Sandaracinobacteroides sayramensis TaxID=2913411 RepID=UPI001EDA085C|nr:polysaccharide pyruvyl transferase family protein [Sandaracinobacteroides sayramensis]MCG2840241.1 polysaccharide pyruvyl transferase family protein [Sandaracinobacteroides sayramensis]
MTRRLSIGLLWHSDSSGNLGVGALTVGNMALVKRAADRAGVDVEMRLFRPGDKAPSYVADGLASRHDITGKFMASPGGYWAALKPLDLMLDIGAGDSFADIYPDKRFAYMMATKELCLWRGIPLVFSPQTIGPFSRQPHTRLAGRVMEKARAVFARDPMSFEAIGKLAPRAHAKQAIDVAFALPFTPAAKGPGVRAGVNVSGLLYSGGYGGQNDYGLTIDYRALTERLIEGLLQRGARVELISHVTTPMARDDDLRAAEAIHAKYPETLVVPAFASPSAAKSYISGLDFLVAARMHASIAAWSSGVAVLPVSYSRKFEGLYKALDYPWLIPAKGFSTDDALAKALDAFERRAELQADIGRGKKAVEDGLETYVSYLAGLFDELAR